MPSRTPLEDDRWRLISQHQTPSDDGAVRSIIPPIGTIGRTSLAVEATKVFHPGDLNDRVGPSNVDVEYRHDVAILSNDVVVAEPCEIEHVGNTWQWRDDSWRGGPSLGVRPSAFAGRDVHLPGGAWI